MKILINSFIVTFGLSLIISTVSANTQQQVIELGTATKGGGFELFGKTLSSVVNKAGGPVTLKPIATKGSKQNLKFLEQGKIVLGQVEGNAARQALEGIGRNKLNMRVLSVMYPNPGMFVVRADSPYKSIEDLKGKPIAFGTQASGLRILVNDVLNGLNLDPKKDFQQIILNKAAQGPAMVLDKKAEALWGAGIGWPGFVKVANTSVGARFIPPNELQIEKVLQKHSHLKRMQIPAGTYKGQQQAINSIGLWSLILISPSVKESTAYELVKAMHQSEQALAAVLNQGRYTTVKNTLENVDRSLLHPGVLKYYRELKLIN